MTVNATHVELAKFRSRCSNDTGFAARYLFEFNYDEEPGPDGIPVRTNRPNGGIRRDGPHKDMTDFIDGPGREKLLLAPRGSYKTCILKSTICRRILKDRDTTVLYAMMTESMAKSKVKDMGRMLLSPLVEQVYGPVKGKKWNTTQIFLSGRSHNVDQSSPNIQACGVEQGITGSHYSVIVVDDVVDWDTVRTEDQIQRTLDFFKSLIPILAPGGVLIVVGTRYADQDLYGYIQRELNKSFQVLRLDCGMRVLRHEDGSWDLEGDPVYPHLDEKHLRATFDSMNNPSDFVSQYMNEIMSSAEQLFTREQFQSIPRWEDWMGDCSGYILTDSAATTTDHSCYSALCLVGLDYRDHAFLFDLRVGKMKPYEFVQNFVDLLERWGSKIFIKGCLFENIALNETYRAMIVEECRSRHLSPNLIPVPRGVANDSKNRRISKLQGRFASGRFHVVGSVPTHFNDLGKSVELWNPEGWQGEDDLFPKPAGELVNEFILWPRYSKNDIADALADIDGTDSGGRRYCPPAPRAGHNGRWPRVHEAPGAGMPIAPVVMSINGIDRQVDVGAGPPGVGGESWWDQASRQISRSGRNRSSF